MRGGISPADRHAAALRAPARLRCDPADSASLVALSQFDGHRRLAGSLLASGAIAAAIVGFAARQTLANLVAGIMLADHPAAPRRRLGHVRGPLRRRRGRAAELHGPAHAVRAADRDPERAARRAGSCATTRSSRRGRARRLDLAAAPAADVPRALDVAAASDGRDRRDRRRERARGHRG